MRKQDPNSPSRRPRMNAGALALFVEKFAEHLTGLGHSRLTVTCFSDSARHFADWLCRVGIVASDVDDRVLDEFAHHRCQCPGGRRGRLVSPNYLRRVRRVIVEEARRSSSSYVRTMTTPDEGSIVRRRIVAERGQQSPHHLSTKTQSPLGEPPVAPQPPQELGDARIQSWCGACRRTRYDATLCKEPNEHDTAGLPAILDGVGSLPSMAGPCRADGAALAVVGLTALSSDGRRRTTDRFLRCHDASWHSRQGHPAPPGPPWFAGRRHPRHAV